MRLLIFLLLVSMSSVLGCGADIEGILDPCLYKEGEEITATAFGSGKPSVIHLEIEDCNRTVVLRVSNPRYVRAGSRVRYKILERNGTHSYEVRIIKVYD